MTIDSAHLLHSWATGPEDDQYRNVRSDYGFNQPRSKREVRRALRVLGLRPLTSADYADIRSHIRKGAMWWDELV